MHNKIAIKKALRDNEHLRNGIVKQGANLALAIATLSSETGLGVLFIEQNLQTIRNWV